MARITAVINRKGGVGKSTLTVNVAAVAAEVLGEAPSGEPDYVVAVSSDPQGSATWWSERVGNDLPFSFIQTKSRKDLTYFPELKKTRKVKHAFIDTPGWMDLPDDEVQQAGDPFGDSAAADAMRAVLANADDLIIPVEPEPLGFIPTQTTIEEVVKPLGLPYWVVINNWDPRDGLADLEDTRAFIEGSGWNLANTVIRHYKVHARAAVEGTVVTRYKKNRVAMEAREDFYKLALEIGAGAKRR
ncbi:ParA family protein [Streptomyces bambusae]|uniref:ParA family protein n=1 Tax=Streptomyces bambusae TaxID=1550616 RepID=UPI001CFF4449|nr:ParA family protein [Streptomyces bambusae]MCB5166564.1 ParA family protein [Streptomyces bambusae]